MKKLAIILAACLLTAFANESFAQTKKSDEEAGKESMKVKGTDSESNENVKKIVTYDEHKGEKVLTIKTTINGKTTTETYKGKEAENKIKEMEAEANQSKNVTKIEVDGKKMITIEKEKTTTKSK